MPTKLRQLRGWRRRTSMGIAVAVAVSLAMPLVGGLDATPAAAVPLDPTQIYIEDFENNTAAQVISLTGYVGSDGTTYSAAGPWLNRSDCNNLILRYEGPTWAPGDCGNNAGVRHNVQRLADVLGQVDAGVVGGATTTNPVDGSTADTRNNHAASAYTYQLEMAPNLAVFESSELPERLGAGRFYTSSIDIAELSCEYAGGRNNSRLDFENHCGR